MKEIKNDKKLEDLEAHRKVFICGDKGDETL